MNDTRLFLTQPPYFSVYTTHTHTFPPFSNIKGLKKSNKQQQKQQKESNTNS